MSRKSLMVIKWKIDATTTRTPRMTLDDSSHVDGSIRQPAPTRHRSNRTEALIEPGINAPGIKRRTWGSSPPFCLDAGTVRLILRSIRLFNSRVAGDGERPPVVATGVQGRADSEKHEYAGGPAILMIEREFEVRRIKQICTLHVNGRTGVTERHGHRRCPSRRGGSRAGWTHMDISNIQYQRLSECMSASILSVKLEVCAMLKEKTFPKVQTILDIT
ncbi:hypothetical protein C8R43DRAFT_956287 [Mycena crocata]|nr:hypothetical protein C8R43DRAFT_956287 [Mycena crocata]